MIIIVKGDPKGKARPRVTRGGQHTYTPGATKDYEKLIQVSFRQQNGQKKEGYLSAGIKAYFKIPKSYSKKKRQDALDNKIMPDKKPDIDNIAKCILDALNGLAYEDDKQIVYLVISKWYSEEPRVEVNISELDTSNW